MWLVTFPVHTIPRITKITLALVLLTALLISLVTALPPVHDPQIAFESYKDGNAEIYLLDIATGIFLNLTHHEMADGHPSWSPDGRRLAFASNRTDNFEIFVMNADGSGVYNLTRHISDDTEPTWSPDGTQIAFISRRSGNSEIYIMDMAAILADSTCAALPDILLRNPTQACAPPVRRLTNSAADETSPVWSPDGRRIVFVQETDHDSEIYTMSVQCPLPQGCPADRYDLSDDPARDRFPAWSPDGRRLAFASNRGRTWDIYLMNADGAYIRRLTDGAGAYITPSWSADGTQIVFAGRQAGRGALHVVDTEGSILRRLMYMENEVVRPVWRP